MGQSVRGDFGSWVWDELEIHGGQRNCAELMLEQKRSIFGHELGDDLRFISDQSVAVSRDTVDQLWMPEPLQYTYTTAHRDQLPSSPWVFRDGAPTGTRCV